MDRTRQRTMTNRRSKTRPRSHAYVFGAAVTMLLLALLSFQHWHERREALDQARRDVENLAGILEQNMAGRIHIIDYALLEIVQKVERSLRDGSADALLADTGWLHERRARLPEQPGIGIVDARGIVTAATTIPDTPGVDISDRDYYQLLRDAPGIGLNISTPYEARGRAGLWAISLSRAFARSDGAFGGIVVASIPLDRLTQSFAMIDVGETGAVAMWNAAGVLLARYPESPTAIGRPTSGVGPGACTLERPAATFETAPGSAGNPVRIAACRTLGSYPLTVAVALGRDEALAEWRREATLFAVVISLVAGAVLLLAWRIARLHQAALGSAGVQLRDAIDSIGDGFVLYDASDRIEEWNRKLIEQRPYLADLQPLAGRTFEEMLRAGIPHMADPEARRDPEGFIARRLRERRNPSGEPALRQLVGGRWFMVYDRRTTLGGIVSIWTDVTSLKRNEERLEQLAEGLAAAKRQAEDANRAKSRFMASMSHELRTPLNAVIGFAEIIENQVLGAQAADRYVDYARDIRRSGAHLLELINDILDMSKIEAGKRELVDDILDVAEVAEACLRMLRARAADGAVDIVSALPPYLPPLRADRRAVKQVLLNLLSNAVKFTPTGGKVTLSAAPAPDGSLSISVSDTGVGVPADHLTKVFEPFRQIDRDGYGKPEGTGLGLSICKGLMEAHGGSIVMVSDLGRGTTVTIAFPAERIAQRLRAVAAG